MHARYDVCETSDSKLICAICVDLCWKLDFLAFDYFRDVEVEEVAVENGLNEARADRDQIVESLVLVPVDPVEQIKCSIHAQSEKIVACDGLGFASFTDHEKLR